MKIGILTFHTALNFGALLQTYALYKILRDKGENVKIINYKSTFNEKRFAPKSLRYFLNPRTLYGIIFRNGLEFRNKLVFENFLNKNLELTSPIYDRKDLAKINDDFDIFIAGSDQVWNLACTEGDDSYYLPFVLDSTKRNSYAASIGYTSIPSSQESIYTKLMSGFNHISVREKSGVEIVRKLTGKEAELVLDPTLLLSKKQWEDIADYSKVPVNEKYLLLYLMAEDKVLIKKAKDYAKKNKLKILYINQRLFKLSRAKNLRNVSPKEWLGLFLKADTIFTNSFHGLVFSVNFNKNFFTRYIPRSIANSRLETVLDELNLHNRRISSNVYCEERLDNFEHVEDTLQQLKNKSLLFINKILDDTNE